MKYLVHLIVLMTTLFICGCSESFEYSPNQVFDRDSKISLNSKNLAWLQSMPQDDTITIAFVGDSQRFYDELDKFIDTVNTISAIDFILLAGDISDFGLLLEFELITEMFSRVNKPYIGVVGNHDVLSKGEEVFKKMFGACDTSFVYQGVKFVVHNTNGKEYLTGNVPDLDWLKNELVVNDSVEHIITVSHVPPFSQDFDAQLEMPYVTLLQEAPGLLMSLHGHIHEHKDGYPYSDSVRYITTHSFDKRSFVLLKIYSGNIDKTIIDY